MIVQTRETRQEPDTETKTAINFIVKFDSYESHILYKNFIISVYNTTSEGIIHFAKTEAKYKQ